MSWNRILWACIAATALAGAQTPPFQVLDDPIPSTVAWANAIGDLDGDGDADLLDTLSSPTVYLNDGHGRFTGVSVPSLSFVGLRTILADFDANGLVDVLSISGNYLLRLDLNGGGLGFVGPSPLPVLTTPLGGAALAGNMAVADVDLDGDLDIMIETTYGAFSAVGVLQLWLNNGSALFSPAPASQFPSAAFTRTHLILRDLDGNGYPDAIFAGYTSTSIQVALNTGGIFTLSPAMNWNAGAGGAITALDVGDFDADGRPDLVFGSTSPPAGSGIAGVIMNSPGGFLPPVVTNGIVAGVVRAVDVNGDGMDEVLIQSSSSAPASMPGLSLHAIGPGPTIGPPIQSWPTSTLLAPGGTPWGVYSGAATGAESVRDLDGDNDRDVLVSDGANPATLMNDGVSGFIRTGGHVHGLAIARPEVGDVNGDGHLDILGFGPSATPILATGLNDGDGNFHPGPSTSVLLPSWSTIYANYAPYTFDKDGDGDSDIYLAHTLYAVGTTPYDIILDNTGGVFAPVGTVAGAGYAAAFKTADLDGDGDQDVLLGRRTYTGAIAPSLLLVLNLGPAGFSAPAAVGTSHKTYSLEIGDFDGNGAVDVFQANFGLPADPCVLYLNSGGATFTAVTQPFGSYYTAAGDLNNDGMTDIVSDSMVHFSVGGGAFVPGSALPALLVAPAVLADVDFDGDLDLVETPARVMLNLGGATFGPPMTIMPHPSGTPTGLDTVPAVVDLDRDGDPDIVAPGPIIVSNVMRQIAHGSWARPGRPASIDIYGTPGGAWALFASNGTAAFPFAPLGNVLIDPASAVLFATGALGGPTSPNPGLASVAASVPNNPALVGWTTYWQAVDMTALKTTNRLTITVQGY